MIELNALSLLCALTMPPLVAFAAYWTGFNRGKREGYVTGRNLLRVPVRNDR